MKKLIVIETRDNEIVYLSVDHIVSIRYTDKLWEIQTSTGVCYFTRKDIRNTWCNVI